MKTLIMSVVMASAVAAIAADEATLTPTNAPAAKRENLTLTEKLARRMKGREMYFARAGGKCVRPNSTKGVVTIVNCQKRASEDWLKVVANYFHFEASLIVEVKDGTFDLASPKVVGELSLFVTDDEKLPPVLLAPESRWSMVNINELSNGNGAKPQFFEARVKKQVSRGLALLCGASNSQFRDALTGGKSCPEDLDTNFDYQLPVDIFPRFESYLKPFGVVPASYTSYAQACTEGWAAQPTNDQQKAIWNKVHELPKNPLKLEK